MKLSDLERVIVLNEDLESLYSIKKGIDVFLEKEHKNNNDIDIYITPIDQRGHGLSRKKVNELFDIETLTNIASVLRVEVINTIAKVEQQLRDLGVKINV